MSKQKKQQGEHDELFIFHPVYSSQWSNFKSLIWRARAL
jgi:hypothetical protein